MKVYIVIRTTRHRYGFVPKIEAGFLDLEQAKIYCREERTQTSELHVEECSIF